MNLSQQQLDDLATTLQDTSWTVLEGLQRIQVPAQGLSLPELTAELEGRIFWCHFCHTWVPMTKRAKEWNELCVPCYELLKAETE